jgi:hypothetical protein
VASVSVQDGARSRRWTRGSRIHTSDNNCGTIHGFVGIPIMILSGYSRAQIAPLRPLLTNTMTPGVKLSEREMRFGTHVRTVRSTTIFSYPIGEFQNEPTDRKSLAILAPINMEIWLYITPRTLPRQ